MNTSTAIKKQSLDLGRLSAVSKIALKKPEPSVVPDAEIELSRIYSIKQVRTNFNNLEELAESFKLNGILQPLVVHEEADSRYRIIIGERRFRAAPLAALAKVPVTIKRGLSELDIRRMQVAENNDREDLSAYDQAMGVIEDVERYGMDEARRIWNQSSKSGAKKEALSKGWISKRVAVSRYAAPVLALLKDGLCEDFEILHSLNELFNESEDEFNHIMRRLNDGLPLSRDEARNKVSAIKQFKRDQAELRKRRETQQAQAVIEAQQAKQQAKGKVGSNADMGGEGQDAGNIEPLQGKKSLKVSAHTPTPADIAAAQRQRDQDGLVSLRKECFEWGEVYLSQFNSMKNKMDSLDFDMSQSEWVMWSGFLSTVLPLMASLGEKKTVMYLKKLKDELRTKSPLDLWRELHPRAPAGAPEDEDGPRVEVPPMPDGWRF